MSDQSNQKLRAIEEMSDQEVNELFSDIVFVKSLMTMESLEEAQVAFNRKGVDVSLEGLASLREYYKTNKAELSLDDLDAVAGGKGTIFGPRIGPSLRGFLIGGNQDRFV